MPDDNGNPTPEETLAQKTAELEQMSADLKVRETNLANQASQNNELNRTMAGLTEAIRQQNQPVAEPDPDLEGEFDEATVRAGAALSKKQLEAYHNAMAPEIQELRAGQFNSEWNQLRAEDPKNFGRLANTMQQHFDANPELKRPGAAAELFTRLKGHHYNKLQEMDRAERQQEIENPEPNPTTITPDKKAKSADTLDENEWGLIRGMGRENDGSPNVHPEHYFLSKYGRYPNFDEKYLEDRGYTPVERGK